MVRPSIRLNCHIRIRLLFSHLLCYFCVKFDKKGIILSENISTLLSTCKKLSVFDSTNDLATWTVMETIIGVVGLAGVLLLNVFI